MQFEAQLVHAEAGKRVVQVRAMANDQCLGSALGEGPTAEEAEDRASTRLLARLGVQRASNQQTQTQPKPPKPDHAMGAIPIPRPIPAASPAQIPAQIPAAISVPISSPDPFLDQGAAPTAQGTAQASSQAVPQTTPEPAPNDVEPQLPPFQQLERPQEDFGGEPEDWSSELARLDLQLQRIGWTREEEAIFLERAFSHPSRNRLTSYADIVAYLNALEGLDPGSNPGNAPVPLRRKDLLSQCDQLLGQLRWDSSQGRTFLEQHFSLSSRQQLNDTQLLEFNMLLEGELMEA
jgi:hypothetical protein